MLKLSKIIAHRGASAYATENSLAALHLAKQKGATWVEFDIQLSRDGDLMVFHDSNLKRLCGIKGKMKNYNSEFLQQCVIENKKLPAITSSEKQYIPSLELWLEQAAELNLALNIELKSAPRDANLIARELIKLINQQNAKRQLTDILISSSKYKNLLCLQRLLPQIPRAMVIPFWQKRYLKQAIVSHCYSIHLDCRVINQKIIDTIKAHNIKIAAYTVNCPKLASKLLGQGVDAVFSDYPDLMSLTNKN